jgi:hypothetical protein
MTTTDDIDAGNLNIDPDEMEGVLEGMIAPPPRRRRSPRAVRYIGAPLSFVREVCLLTDGRTALVVALCIYRRTRVCSNGTVTLPATNLAELEVDRRRKREALAQLQRAGLIEVRNQAGRTARITLTWRPS